jgi:amino-acid N-acetyltransferase
MLKFVNNDTHNDIVAVEALLRENGLPFEDIGEHIGNFVLAWEHGALVGTAGVELLGSDGLLRSVCVSKSHRSRGVAAELCRRAEASARHAGVNRLYLLITTAKEYFERRGYSVCSRESLPIGVQGTAEFRSLCPSTAVCMVRSFEGEALYLSRDLLPLRKDETGSRMWSVSLSRAMLSYFEVEPHTRFETHSHEGEQITTVFEGELCFELGEEIIRVREGEVIAIPSGVAHAVFTQAVGAKAYDAWSPPPPKYSSLHS